MRAHLKLLLAAGVAAASFAAPGPAAAIVRCQHGDVSCYQTCYVPNIDKQHGVYWNYC